MCGIFGIIVSPDSKLVGTNLRAGVLKAFGESERRGKDSSGAMYVSSDKVVLTKSAERGKKLIKTWAFRKLLKEALSVYSNGDIFMVLGHTRMATHGSTDLDENNQPIVSNCNLVLHNGIIVNHEEIFQTRLNLKREFEVDTEVIPLLIQDFCKKGLSEYDAVASTTKCIRGANTFLYLNRNSTIAYLNSSNGSLYVLEKEDLFVFASELQTLKRILLELKFELQDSDIYQPSSDEIVSVYLRNYVGKNFRQIEIETDKAADTKRDLLILERQNGHPKVSALESFTQVRAKLSNDFYSKLADFSKITRCRKCILPINYPYLSFDDKGICELCQQVQVFPQYGTDRLFNDLGGNNNNSILVPISGGRDSCYALHYIVNELGMKATAFTYDWGFVTDVARRNISRMCGELGVEHILVAADLKMKRRNVQRNVSAWLKKPHLGMVPLLMAGDKHFFRFASDVKRELNLSNSIFGMTRFEPASFKTGFAGINEGNQFEKTFDLGISNKIKLVSFYTKQTFSNPKYINMSLPDSISGYYSYYLRKIDFLQLFDYIKWNEQSIITDLKSIYGWESSDHCRNTWRIGDASAPFYNYIYSFFAGFTENDVYLSNLIRDKQITRETALNLILDYNLPDEVGFMKYCDLIDLDSDSVLKHIHKFEGFRQ